MGSPFSDAYSTGSLLSWKSLLKAILLAPFRSWKRVARKKGIQAIKCLRGFEGGVRIGRVFGPKCWAVLQVAKMVSVWKRGNLWGSLVRKSRLAETSLKIERKAGEKAAVAALRERL